MIIRSLLDTDQYIFTMAQAILHQCPAAKAKFKFKCRNGSAIPKGADPEKFLSLLNKELDHLCELRLRNLELSYLSHIRYFKQDFIEILRLLKLNRDYIHAYLDKDKELQVEAEGPLFFIIWFEVPVLATISQLNTQLSGTMEFESIKTGKELLERKVSYLKSNLHNDSKFLFADFGTRRRYHYEWHKTVLEYLKREASDWFIGTSNVHFAMELALKPIGTMAHLWFQAFQRMGFQLAKSQQAALSAWVEEYQGDLGIALSDIGGFDWFLKDFNLFYAKLFDGCRHDSGDPFWWADKLITHYEKLGINPLTKSAVFSDGLSIPLAVKLYHTFNRRINTSFGIGTNLTNDMGFKALQIVMKMVECNGGPVSKRSDSSGKGMCEDPEFDAYFGKVIKEEIANGSNL